jgi:hypothetical protein
MAAAFRAIDAGSVARARGLAGRFGYDVRSFVDTPTGRSLVVLAERRDPDGTWPHGWGLYVHATGSASPIAVAVAHPVDDVETALTGTDVFRMARASDLFIAGTSRYADPHHAADMAHSPDSVFQAITEAALASVRLLFEPHGFDEEDHPKEGQAVISAGVETPSAPARLLASALAASGYSICLYNGTSCEGLGATTNVQGAAARAAGTHFLHVELDLHLRQDPTARAAVDSVIARALVEGATAEATP